MSKPLTTTDKLILSGMLPTEASRHRLLRILREQGERVEWEQLRERGQYLLLFPLLRYNLSRAGALSLLPPAIQELLGESAATWAARELGAVSEARRLILLLQAHGIQALPLKGIALMIGGFYPQPGLRPSLDIDLLVPPEEASNADLVLAQHGYTPLPGRRAARQRQRLPNEQNHLWPRRSPGGQVVEIHHRAFHYSGANRDFGYEELWQTARSINAGFLPIPTPGDLAFHLIHHTLVDLQSGHAILRTISDLYFIFRQDPHAFTQACRRGVEYGFPGAVYLAEQAVNHLASANLEALEVDAARPELELLLETALLTSHDQLAEAARIFEYFNFTRQPLRKFGNLLALLFPTREHLGQLYGQSAGRQPEETGLLLNYLRRPIDLVRRIDWQSLRPANLRRVRLFHQVTRTEPPNDLTTGPTMDRPTGLPNGSTPNQLEMDSHPAPTIRFCREGRRRDE
ncbi:MAG: nucleotidyltransferase family protein, partial [Acidobacteriota bacterium]